MEKEKMRSKRKQNYSELKALLKSWNLKELLVYFQEEQINIEELLLMKYHHIDQILKHFKHGIRIRFEHCLEHWRLAQNKPIAMPFAMENHQSYYDSMMESIKNSHAVNDSISSFGNKEALMENLLTPNFLPMEPFVALTELEPDIKPYASINERSSEHDNMQPTGSRSSSANGETTMVNESVLNSDVTVKHILLNSGPKGKDLYNFRLENEPLTQAQRTLLIQLIVHYFELHDLHLSLTLSHILETQILTIFTKEQLSFYRTEKRGKIYVKFTNMKRYRRERPSKSRRSGGSLSHLPTSTAGNDDEKMSEKKRFRLEDVKNLKKFYHNN